MYIQITNRCNMSCGHCGFSCTKTGKDMTIKTWNAALSFAKEWGDNIELGGGEPTLHKSFWHMLGEAIGTVDGVWLATNGSQTQIALKLAHLAKRGVIGCALSLDDYHDPIDDAVELAFKRNTTKHGGFDNHVPDCREIRNSTNNVIKSGRATWGKEECVCEGLIILPDGKIKACGCKDAPIFGTVFDPKIPDDWDVCNCHKDQMTK